MPSLYFHPNQLNGLPARHDVTKLGELTGWDDKPTKGYPQTNFRFPEQSPLVLARAIAVCLQAGVHPFDHPAMAQLVEVSKSVDTFWSLHGMVIGPIQALQILGVDIFTDERYETWVLRTLWYELFKFDGFPTLFNHSCDPNAETGLRGLASSAVEEQISTKDIEEGEEVYVTYIDNLATSRQQRIEQLRTWLVTTTN
jgi:hypothetical protein